MIEKLKALLKIALPFIKHGKTARDVKLAIDVIEAANDKAENPPTETRAGVQQTL